MKIFKVFLALLGFLLVGVLWANTIVVAINRFDGISNGDREAAGMFSLLFYFLCLIPFTSTASAIVYWLMEKQGVARKLIFLFLLLVPLVTQVLLRISFTN